MTYITPQSAGGVPTYSTLTNGVYRRYIGTTGTAIFKKLNSGPINKSSNLGNVFQTALVHTLMDADIVNGETKLYCHSTEPNGGGYAKCRILLNGVAIATSAQAVNATVTIVTPAVVGDVVTFQVLTVLSNAPTLQQARIIGDIETIDIRTYE